jgi:DNA-directed RNA polymerase specialized sigma subunit
MMENVSIPLDRENVSGTRNTKGFEGTMLKMIDKEQELEDMIQDLLEKRSKITSVIETVKNPQEYDVLHQTYVQEKAVKEIAYDLNYSMTYIRKLKKNGIQSVQNILDSSF